MAGPTLCILGCGNLGTSLLTSLINAQNHQNGVKFERFVACVRSQSSKQRLNKQFAQQIQAAKLAVVQGDNVRGVTHSHIVILGVDPADIATTLKQEGLADALKGKLLISIAAGWSREALENLLAPHSTSSNEEERIWVLRTLPNIAAQVSQSLTAIEDPREGFPSRYMEIAESIFSQIGKTVHIAPKLMNATTAVGGSTPAFFAVICDSLIDAAVAVGVPRAQAQVMIYQSMKGTAEMLQSGVHPGILKDQGTSPEGCTIGGLMVMEEGGVRGHLGKALRESVTIAREMESRQPDLHVNDTRRR